MIPVAFYAPLKSPDHPSPSGDRTMARLLLGALGAAGFAPVVASRLRSFDRDGDPARQAALRDEAGREVARILAGIAARPPAERPRLWFTYHGYYKAPDHLGPAVARALGLPLALAETTRAAKRAAGAWADGHAATETAIRAADAILVMTARDRPALAAEPAVAAKLVSLPPFLDAPPAVAVRRGDGAPRLLAVGMMRPGDKLASFRLLATALGRIADRAWSLDVAGDGAARAEIEAAFAPLGERVRFHGRLETAALRALYGRADLLVWPAVAEAYGMAPLEAQAAGCPVVAGGFGGVADAMRAGETGLLVPPGDGAAFEEAFAAAVAALLVDPGRRRRMGAAAARFVAEERSLAAAASILRGALMPLVRAA